MNGITLTPTTQSPVTIQQQPDGWYCVALYGQPRISHLPSEGAARLHVGLLEAVYAADLATCDHERYGTAAAIEAAIAARVGDSEYVSRPAALTDRAGWELPWNGYAGIVTGNTVELWQIACGDYEQLVCVYTQQPAPPVIDRRAVQALPLSSLASYVERFARCQGWDEETAWQYVRFFAEPFGPDIRISLDNPAEVLWHYGDTWIASRPVAERAALLQTAREWFAAKYPDSHAGLAEYAGKVAA